MLRIICYSIEEVVETLKSSNNAYIAVDSCDNAYIINANGFSKVCISKEVFNYIISNYNLTIGTI